MTKPTIFQLFAALSHQCYENSKNKGFWHEGAQRNKAEMVALINSELYKALEAHREDRWFSKVPLGFAAALVPLFDGIAISEGNQDSVTYYKQQFEDHCKSTVEDELGDVFVRICDYTIGWGTGVYERKIYHDMPENFAEGILLINELVNLSYRDQDVMVDWGYTLGFIQRFCDRWGIDLGQHVRWKMRYNSMRQKMHGKAY